MTQAKDLATDALFTQYLHVVNDAIGQHRDELPYKAILDSAEKAFDGTTVAVGVYKDSVTDPHDWFVVGFDGGTFSLEKHGKGDADITWKIPSGHLEEVVENPDEFRRSPYKLDLDWLKKTIGL